MPRGLGVRVPPPAQSFKRLIKKSCTLVQLFFYAQIFVIMLDDTSKMAGSHDWVGTEYDFGRTGMGVRHYF